MTIQLDGLERRHDRKRFRDDAGLEMQRDWNRNFTKRPDAADFLAVL